MNSTNDSDHPTDTEVASLAYLAQHHYRNGRLQQAKERMPPHPRWTATRRGHPNAWHDRPRAEGSRDRGGALRPVPRTRAGSCARPPPPGSGTAAVGPNGIWPCGTWQKSVSLDDGNRNAHVQLGDTCTKLGRRQEAAEAYGRALELDREDIATTIKLGNTLLATQRFADAVDLYERAVDAFPESAPFHRHLGAVLHRMGQTQRSIDHFEEALRVRPDYAKARIDYALVLRQLGRTEHARDQLEEAIRISPEEVDGHLSLALTFRQEGRTDLAIQRLEELLAANPGCGAAHHHIALIKPSRDLVPRVERLLAGPRLPKDDAVHCHFALGSIFNASHASDATDRAFRHYQTANSLQRRTISYDPDANTELFERLVATYSKDFLERKRSFGNPSRLPVFIVGLPRSGTTLVEQILASHGAIHGAGEIESLAGVNHSIARKFRDSGPAPECMSLIDGRTVDEFSELYLAELKLRSPTATRVVDKLPGNFVRVGLIKTLFPDAYVLHCTRSPRDTCLSLYFHYFQALACSFDLRELGRYFLDYRRLMAHWEAVFPGGIFEVRYEDLVAEPERISRSLIDYLDLDWDEECLAFHRNERSVMSPSNIQVRRPLYTTSIDRWRRYERHLGPLIEVLDSH